MPRRGIMVLLTTVALAVPLFGHDFWLVPLGFHVAPGETLTVLGQTSSAFPSTQSAVTLDRVASATIIDAAGTTPVTDLAIAGNSLRLRIRPPTAGQKIVALTIHPRSVRESSAAFQRYLVLEGAPEALERLKREGRVPRDSVTRRYAKYAKSLVTVGQGGPAAWTRAAGHPLEFVLVGEPALAAGQTLAVRLVYRGQPVPNAVVHAGVVPFTAPEGLDALAGKEHKVDVTTDAEGMLRVPLASAGLWNLRTIQIVEADAGSGADWDTHWATLVFAVEAGQAGARSDSAEVVAAVDRFHAALASGDSVAVANLLAPDAVILESGGVETRAQYLGGHLRGDIAFAQAVPRERGAIQVHLEGPLAWATSTSITRGDYRGRAVNSVSAELMVLMRTPEGWRIRAIHWSSRARPAAGQGGG